MTPELLWLCIGGVGMVLALAVIVAGVWCALVDMLNQAMAGIGWWE